MMGLEKSIVTVRMPLLGRDPHASDSTALADIYFRVKNIKDVLGVASKDELTLWVLMLLRISVNEEQEIEAKCEPRLVPKEGSFAEGQVRQKYVIKYDGMRNHPSEQELKW